MIAETKKARGLTLAERNIEQIKSYRERDGQSSRLKEKIGEVLLCLAAGRAEPDGLQQFDRLLRLRWERG